MVEKKRKEKKNERLQSHIASPTGSLIIIIMIIIILKTTTTTTITIIMIICNRGAIPRTLVQSNVVRSRQILLINEEINEVNWMVSNSAKLDRRTEQHTQFGVSASNSSRDMARKKSWQKKKNEKE